MIELFTQNLITDKKWDEVVQMATDHNINNPRMVSGQILSRREW